MKLPTDLAKHSSKEFIETLKMYMNTRHGLWNNPWSLF